MDKLSIKKYTIPESLNTGLLVFLLLFNFYLLFVLPILIHFNPWWSVTLLSVFIFSNTHWALIHEGIHRSLFRSKTKNNYWSRVLGICFGVSFCLVRFFHLMHHRFNRTNYDQNEVFDSTNDYKLPKQIKYYAWLCGGLYWFEVLGALLAFLPIRILKKLGARFEKRYPDVYRAMEEQLFAEKMIVRIRVNTVLIAALYTASFLFYGPYWFLLLAALLVRGFLISVADNLPHYNTPINETFYAFNLKAPKWLSCLLLNLNYSRAHHRNPNIPWTQLPRFFKETDGEYEHSYFQQWRNQFYGLIPVERLSFEPIQTRKDAIDELQPIPIHSESVSDTDQTRH